MATFQITNPTEKEWNQKRFVEATLQMLNPEGEAEGEKYQISFWAGEISLEGGLYRSKIDGELSKNEKGYWKLSSPKQAAGANFKAIQTEKLMDKKADSIATAQHNKENGIRIASSMNGAIQLALAEYANPNNLYTLKELIEKWREYIWVEWEKVDKYPPF